MSFCLLCIVTPAARRILAVQEDAKGTKRERDSPFLGMMSFYFDSCSSLLDGLS